MVYKKTPADSGSGMDFNTGKKATNMRDKTSKEPELSPPEKISQTMKP
jgi:hypothetical protein